MLSMATVLLQLAHAETTEQETSSEGQQAKKLDAIIVTATDDRAGPETNYTVKSSTSATKLDLKLKETPQSITVFTEQQLQDQDIRDVHEVLQNTPGVSTTNFGIPGTGAYRMMARGFDIDNFTIDGVKVNMAVLGGASGAAIQDTFLYQQVDLIRGSTGLTSGFGNPSASVNFTRKRPFSTPQGQINLKYGSWNNIRQELDYSSPLNQEGTWRGRVAFANEQGDYWIDRASHNGFTLYGITELDVGNGTFTLGASHQYKRFNELSPQGIAGNFQSWDARKSASERRSYYSFKDLNLSRSFNNASDWTYNWYKMTNAFAGYEYTLDNDWKIVANYNYAHNDNDSVYGAIGRIGYYPDDGYTSLDVGHNKYQTDVHSLDVHLKGAFELFGREHDFVIGVDGYHSKQTQYVYSILGLGTGCALNISKKSVVTGLSDFINGYGCLISLDQWNNGHLNRPSYIGANNSGFSLDDPYGYYTSKSKELGTYFALRLRPLENLQMILGGRYSHLDSSKIYTNRSTGYKNTAQYGDPDVDAFVPYAGLIYEITPEINVYASYTGISNTNEFTQFVFTKDGEYLPPIEGYTWEGGIKAGLFDDRLNLALSYFYMKQKNYPTTDPSINLNAIPATAYISTPAGGLTLPAVAGKGYAIKGVEFNVAGEITPKWKINAGYVYQTKSISKEQTGTSYTWYDTSWATYNEIFINEFLLPKHQIKLFTTYQVNDDLLLGMGANWQSTVRAYTDTYFDSIEAEQKAYTVISAMARYNLTKDLTLGLNAENIFDKKYLVNKKGSFYGTPRNYTVSLNYRF
ncbi:hypothetical protein BJI46_12770 [Acinetobacter qingfengensis]|uniref:TonB-dependent siderophore receptor n=2 Tax=Acinetobacter qingfengensis TaxID=1262585 RepID=A0A1E7R8C9_9GAMM|nr:hypothetical protein BJI46_12770 [Acinetobacter qingfengensis]